MRPTRSASATVISWRRWAMWDSISERTSRSSLAVQGDSSSRTTREAGLAFFAGAAFLAAVLAAVLLAGAAFAAAAVFLAGAAFVAGAPLVALLADGVVFAAG